MAYHFSALAGRRGAELSLLGGRGVAMLADCPLPRGQVFPRKHEWSLPVGLCGVEVNISHVGADPVLEQETEIRVEACKLSRFRSRAALSSFRSAWGHGIRGFTMSVINSAVPKDSIRLAFFCLLAQCRLQSSYRSWWNMVHWAAQDRRLLRLVIP